MRRTSLVLLALFTLALTQGCFSSPQAERQLVSDAVEALGGKSAIEGLKTLRIKGEGTAYLLGQNLTPDADLPTYKVTGYVRTIDLSAQRIATQQTRTAQFEFAGNLVSNLHAGLDGDVAYNVNAESKATRASDRDAKDRRLEILHHPVTILRAALDPASKIENLRHEQTNDVIDVTTAKGDTLTLAVDQTTKLPVRVENRAAHPNLGDVRIATTFENYQEVNGVRLPTKLVTVIDTNPQLTINVTKERRRRGRVQPGAARRREVRGAAGPAGTGRDRGTRR